MIEAPPLPWKLRRGVSRSPAALVVTYVNGDMDAHLSPTPSDLEKLLAKFLGNQEIMEGIGRVDVYRFGVLMCTV